MSDEQRNDEEFEVEGHVSKASRNDEARDDADDEIEAHVSKVSSVRMDSPSNS
jgi:hypothetical protein